tara:strand:- start:444 stop:1217 length:774 start_codon:yes stop_codon:yes gene_type:complete
MKNLSFIGCGHLAKCLIQGLSNKTEYEISGFDIFQGSLDWLESKGHKSLSLEDCCKQSDVIFLCVKPQDIPTLCGDLKEHLREGQEVISVAAGVKLEKLKELLPGARITRVMTNVGTRDNLGVTAIFSQVINDEIISLFNFLGKAFTVENEDQIDLHTVLIGSGPAFFYDLLSEFEEKMQDIVNDKDMKREVTILFLTSIISAIKNGENLDSLVDSVASKGGTTEAGLKFLREKNFNLIFSEAVDRGVERAKELSMD